MFYNNDQIHIINQGLTHPIIHLMYIGMYNYLYPTYDVDQRYRQGNICDIALWLGP